MFASMNSIPQKMKESKQDKMRNERDMWKKQGPSSIIY